MSKSESYWKKRFEALENASNTYGQQTFRQIEPAFDKAQREIEKQIEAWYGRFAKNNNITMQEAKRLLNTKELKEFRWDVKEYIKYGRENDLNQMWMKELENASARVHINRLEALKIRTQHAAEVAFGNELDCIDAMARKVFTEDYYHTIYEIQKGFGIGWEIGQIDSRKLDTLVSKPWAADGKNFSQRIWGQRDQLVSELHTQLTRTCILGKAPDDAINAISKKFNTTKNQAGRLVMTEQAYFHSVAQQSAFDDLDVEEFEVVATLDSHTSEICQEMDGKHFPMKDYQPGVTAPPFHVWCRSVTVPWFEDNYTGERAARDKDGNTYYVPDSMTYKDWKKSMVDGDTSGLEVVEVVAPEKLHEEVKKAKLTVEELNTSGQRMLGEAYEHHRITNDMKMTPYDELEGTSFNPVTVNYGKLSEETANAFNETISELVSEYDTPLQKIRQFTKEEAAFRSNTFAFVTHNYSVDSAELAINPLKMKDYDAMVEKIKELSERGYCVKIPEELADRYIATHEFTHTLINLEQPLSNKTNWVGADYGKIKKARKEIKDVYERYMSEVERLSKKHKDAGVMAIMDASEETWKAAREAKQALDAVKLSNYSLENADEFMAEAFANEKIGVASNPYAKEVVAILDKYFKR